MKPSALRIERLLAKVEAESRAGPRRLAYTQKLELLEARMDEIADRVARDRTNAARERTSTHEAQRLSH